ncbi:DMT family transporter [Fundidesulfovibrio butyratiphilus]
MKSLLLVLAFSAGCCIPIQAGINALLRRTLGDAMQTSLVSFAVGTLALWLYSLLARHTWPSLGELAGVPLWQWTGGLLGAAFVTCTIVLSPKLGAATMTAFLLLGQLAASVALDHFALVGFPEHPASFWRLVGVGLLFLGAWMVRTF